MFLTDCKFWSKDALGALHLFNETPFLHLKEYFCYHVNMKTGVYRHKEYPELLYLLIGLAHHHDSKDEVAVYVPLFTRPEWKGNSSMTFRSIDDFNKTFEWADERMPEIEQ